MRGVRAARTEEGSAPVRVDQPLFLISQVQRSGGTLLLRLLDGHPQCHVVPFQVRGIDAAAKVAPTGAEEAWNVLYDPKLARRASGGYRQQKRDVLRDEQVFPFDLQPARQREIYDACTASLDRPGTRRLVECFFTAYFNAWSDYRGLHGPKRWLVAFEPSIAGSLQRRNAIGRLYPDGKVISIARDPWSWYASARRWEPRWADRERALDHWCKVAGGSAKWYRQAAPRVRIVTFEALLTRTEDTMRRLADWLEIDFAPTLLEPTFNGQPIAANSSFGDVAASVSAKPLERARQELDPGDVAYIEERAAKIYRKLVRRAGKDWVEAPVS